MKLEYMIEMIKKMIEERYYLDDNEEFKNELYELADENLMLKQIIRIKRNLAKTECWKTIAVVEFGFEYEKDYLRKLKSTMTWVALIKQELLKTENTDLYLFLIPTNDIGMEECLRIESTEQFCRKYVLYSEEQILDFLERTFLMELKEKTDAMDGANPVKRAMENTSRKFSWLTEEKQQKWLDDFLNYSGIELAERLFDEEDNYVTD